MRLGEMIAAAVEAARHRDAEQIMSLLAPLAEEYQVSEPRHERMALSASFLMPRDGSPRSMQAVDDVGRQPEASDAPPLHRTAAAALVCNAEREQIELTMGLFTGVLTLPLAPVRGLVWVAEQVQDEAESQLYDEDRIRAGTVAARARQRGRTDRRRGTRRSARTNCSSGSRSPECATGSAPEAELEHDG